jgi:hypothetical protein
MSEMDDKGNDSVTNNVVLLRMIIIIDCHHWIWKWKSIFWLMSRRAILIVVGVWQRGKLIISQRGQRGRQGSCQQHE